MLLKKEFDYCRERQIPHRLFIDKDLSHLVPYDWNIDWIEEEIDSMVSLMNNDKIPEPNLSCKNCAYSEQYAKLVCNPVKDNKEIQGNLF